MKYINEFLSLNSVGDILNCVQGTSGHDPKEISESMSIIKAVRHIVLNPENKLKYQLLDICAGNALTSVTACHVLPIKNAVAVDKKKRSGKYEKCRKFEYIESTYEDYFSHKFDGSNNNPSILVSSHPCEFADDLVNIYKMSDNIHHLVLLLCCIKKIDFGITINSLSCGRAEKWAMYLAGKCGGRFHRDENVLTSANYLLIASKQR